MVLNKSQGNKLDAKFFSTEQGKLVILLVLLAVAAGVYFGFYAGSDNPDTAGTITPVNPSTSPSTSNNVSPANPSTVTNNGDDVQVNVAESTSTAGIKDVFKPLVKDNNIDTKPIESEPKVITPSVNYDIPSIPETPKVQPKTDVQPKNTNQSINDSQIVIQEPKRTIDQLVSVRVTGIVGSGETLMAIMEVDGKSETYRKGDILKEDIKVGDITSHSVVLVKDNEKFEIQLGGK